MQLIRAVGGETLSVRGIMERLQLKSRGNFLKLYLHPALLKHCTPTGLTIRGRNTI